MVHCESFRIVVCSLQVIAAYVWALELRTASQAAETFENALATLYWIVESVLSVGNARGEQGVETRIAAGSEQVD
jgi:hypothetical protein